MKIVLVDNFDSFVYNLVDAFSDQDCTVVRNSAKVCDVVGLNPDLICLSPGPGHPNDAGMMMELIEQVIGRIPLLGVCLGFQAILEFFGGKVRPCGPVHGQSVPMRLTEAGQKAALFESLTTDALPGQPGHLVPVARYHSLGCTDVPAGLETLATTSSSIGEIIMAARTSDGMALGFQFHPESVLTPGGPVLLRRGVNELAGAATKS